MGYDLTMRRFLSGQAGFRRAIPVGELYASPCAWGAATPTDAGRRNRTTTDNTAAAGQRSPDITACSS